MKLWFTFHSGEDTSETLAITLLEGVPGVRTTLRGQEDSLSSSVSPAHGRREHYAYNIL
jgi:hypothetical protein